MVMRPQNANDFDLANFLKRDNFSFNYNKSTKCQWGITYTQMPILDKHPMLISKQHWKHKKARQVSIIGQNISSREH